MIQEEIAVRIEAHEHEIKSLKHRMDSQEEESKSLQKLVVSVEKIALSTEHIMQEQEEQGNRLKALEDRDGEMWRNLTKYLITAIAGIIVGFMLRQIGM